MERRNQKGVVRDGSVPYAVIDPREFLSDDIFRQDDFLAGIERHPWEQYRNKRVLVRGCGDIPLPAWAYMTIATRLVGIARSVRYGNEHDNLVVYRAEKT